MAKDNDSLFLLEVLIDKIVFSKSPCFSDKDFRTCVNIECPAVPPLEICDDDPEVCIARSGGPFVKTFNTGKSCLFSLKEGDISAAMSKFPVKVSVYKSLPCGCLPTKIVMGEATIDMTKEFVQARNKFLEDPTSVSYQALKDSFRIMGPDGAESGEIVMFLRISCFGKLIITRFQGGGGAPNLGAGASNTVVDRSCTSKRDYQTAQDPCACGAARGGAGKTGSGFGNKTCVSGGGGGGVCHAARDPYNSLPCEDPDDPCYCSGPMQPTKENMVCRNTDQYCLHVPKGAPPSALFRQELTGQRWNEINTKDFEQDQRWSEFIMALICGYNNASPEYKMNYTITEFLQCIVNKSELTENLRAVSSTCTVYNAKDTNLSSSFTSLLKVFRRQDSDCSTSHDGTNCKIGMFGQKEIDVYMNIFSEFSHQRASGTQATAFINKCLQVNSAISSRCDASTLNMSSNCDSTCTVSTLPAHQTRRRPLETGQYHDVYFFGRKKDSSKSAGMGYKESKIKLHKTDQTSNTARRGSNSVVNTATAQTKNTKGASTATSTMKAVSIKDDKSKKPCPAAGQVKGDMTATISHIRIGPREPCPVHGKEPCQGPKCIVASSGEEQAPVKVTTVTNPRRGVFEIVIRKMTGAPLAKNELMLEWTPPPSRPPPCGVPCAIPCAIPAPCRPPKCKMIVCKPSKCCKKPCPPTPCRKCCKVTCCSKKCTPCGPLPCSIPCATPCCASPCGSPCKSSPCLRPCPVGRKRPRRARSQPKIKTNRKRTSPCLNRSKACPVVRCRSSPSPCCYIPPCPPRKCCSVAPCKPPKCCKSSCSMCCP